MIAPFTWKLRLRLASLLALTALPAAVLAQAAPSVIRPRTEVAVTGVAMRSLTFGSNANFWQYGGSASVATQFYRGLGVVVDVGGTHTGSTGASGIPLSLVTVTGGVRYRVSISERISAYGQGTIGGAVGFDSLFPYGVTTRPSANGFASVAGGGVDFRVSRLLSVRAVDAEWLRTQLPNGGSNVQNNLRLGAGVVLHLP